MGILTPFASLRSLRTKNPFGHVWRATAMCWPPSTTYRAAGDSRPPRALAMSVEERRHRLRRLRSSVREQDLAWWLRRQLRDIAAVRSGALAPSRRLRDTVRRVEAEPA